MSESKELDEFTHMSFYETERDRNPHLEENIEKFMKLFDETDNSQKNENAQRLLRNLCSFCPNLKIAEYLLKYIDEEPTLPYDARRYEHPLLHELFHQVLHPGTNTAEKLLLRLIDHPKYGAFIDSPDYRDKYGFTALQRCSLKGYRKRDNEFYVNLVARFPQLNDYFERSKRTNGYVEGWF
jgi:hypothetical protein